MPASHPIGIFDSGYGGLTVMKEILRVLPRYDYVYLGDNARAPYGSRSFETVYRCTLEAVEWLFDRGCPLVILACNTASAKALRSIQQNDLPRIAPERRVLGVLRPVTERIGMYTRTGHVGILGTRGTVESGSYPIEIHKQFPDIVIAQEACPLWVPLVENGEWESPGADYFIEKHIGNLLRRDPDIDTLILGCTHYPLLMNKIRGFISPSIRVISQGGIVAESLDDYLKRHPKIENLCSSSGTRRYFTTDSADMFDHQARIFMGSAIQAERVTVP